jgi:FdhD protein
MIVEGERPGPTVETRLSAYEDGALLERFDRLATEEPLEIRLRAGKERRTVAITMRTPGNDFELAAGFLFNEGVLASLDALQGISFCIDRDVDEEQRYNIVNVDLTASVLPELDTLERHFLTTSACGICGKASIESLHARGLASPASSLRVDAAVIGSFPERLKAGQRVFAATGGLHAAALFDASGALLAVREDVGRHNALDKLIGWAFLNKKLPLSECIVMVSGRASFELVQKTVAAGVPMLCAVSAPSSLAVTTARDFGVTLIGFLQSTRFNVYCGAERVLMSGTR